ncbi:MAG: hypothetical protein ABSD74_16495 [Rhizomicrobium sp.]|jgi:DNA-binding CsgD family transcriptional regulator/PAS domain-containing protein
MPLTVIDELLMGALYGPALAGDWRLALDRFRVLLRSSDTALTIMEDGPALLTLETTGRVLTPEMQNRYVRFYGRLDPKLGILAGRRPGYLFNDARHFDADFVARDIFYQEYSRPMGSRHTLDMLMERRGKREVFLAAVRSPKEGPYDVQAETVFQQASCHFVRALELKEKLDLAHRAGAALDRLSFGVMVVDASGRVTLANRIAEDVLAAGEVLQSCQGRLVCGSGVVGVRLESFLRLAISGKAAARTLRFRRSGSRSWTLWGVPLPESSSMSPSALPAVLLVIGDGDWNRLDRRDVVALYGLTDAEAHLALALADGQSLGEYAAGRGVKRSTVRTQLLAVLEKMGVHRQIDVVRLLTAIGKSPVD